MDKVTVRSCEELKLKVKLSESDEGRTVIEMGRRDCKWRWVKERQGIVRRVNVWSKSLKLHFPFFFRVVLPTPTSHYLHFDTLHTRCIEYGMKSVVPLSKWLVRRKKVYWSSFVSHLYYGVSHLNIYILQGRKGTLLPSGYFLCVERVTGVLDRLHFTNNEFKVSFEPDTVPVSYHLWPNSVSSIRVMVNSFNLIINTSSSLTPLTSSLILRCFYYVLVFNLRSLSSYTLSIIPFPP